jgi:uroporphyrinogen-III synthase
LELFAKVVLLKSSGSGSSEIDASSLVRNDRYSNFLKQSVDTPFSLVDTVQINLLHFEFCNKEEFEIEMVKLLKRQDYHCLILTSVQTVRALDALSQLDQVTILKDDIIIKKITVYCVGETTLNEFNKWLTKQHFNYIEFDVKMTKKDDQIHTNNAYSLSQLIINDFKLINKDSFDNYALYPCSTIRKDDMNRELNNSGIKFKELNVYATSVFSEGCNNLDKYLLESDNNEILCLVFFSPSTVDAAFSRVKSLKDLLIKNINKNLCLISAGPSTTQKLNEILNFLSVDNYIYQMGEPSPEVLLKLLNEKFQ